jgi:hypothetical protein
VDETRWTVRVTLTFSVDAEPISGRVLLEDGSGRTFVGWLALVRAVEDALAAARRARAGPGGPGGPGG